MRFFLFALALGIGIATGIALAWWIITTALKAAVGRGLNW